MDLMHLLLLCAIAVSGNSRVASFSTAKRLLHEQVYDGHRSTWYCGCPYGKDKNVQHAPCGYVPKKATSKRATKIEWEHVVAAEAFGRSFVEWNVGHQACIDGKGKSFKGRNCARKMNVTFRLMEADMYNLVPAIGEVNQHRSNYSMAELSGEPREFGACDVEIHDRKVEPRPEIRGDVARTYLYMDAAYPGRGIVSAKNRKLFEAWSKLDPVDEWECERARRIKSIQGNTNDAVEALCKGTGR